MAYTKQVAQAVDNYTARTIPVHVSIRARQVVLSEPEMEALLAQSELIAVGACDCRKEKSNCDGPLDVCLSLNESARRMVAEGKSHPVSTGEALDVLRRSHEAGLVHLAYRQADEDIGVVCSCCACCCWFLNALKPFDYHDAVAESAYVAVFEPGRCTGCGICVERCQFGAWQSEDGEVRFAPARCFGCGLCASTCPASAITLVLR